MWLQVTSSQALHASHVLLTCRMQTAQLPNAETVHCMCSCALRPQQVTTPVLRARDVTAELDTPVQWVQERPLEITHTGAAQAQARACQARDIVGIVGQCCTAAWRTCAHASTCNAGQCLSSLERLLAGALPPHGMDVTCVCLKGIAGHLNQLLHGWAAALRGLH